MLRYRTGLCRFTGRVIRGREHMLQCVGRIITTVPGELVMALDFGFDATPFIGHTISAELVPEIYRSAIEAVHRDEPEYRILTGQLVHLDRVGGLGLAVRGRYFPEGRLGNYDATEDVDASFPFVAAETLGRATA